MTTSLLLFASSGLFALVALYFFFRNDRETRRFLEREDSLIHTTSLEKSRLMSVIGSMGDGIIVLDSNFSPWVVNDAARQFLALTKEQPSFNDITLVFPPKLAINDTIKRAFSQSSVVTLHDVLLNGKTFQIMINPVIEKNGTTHTVGVSILLQDISEEKSMEKMKDDFSNMIVHELRSPIVAIKDSAKMMLKDTTLGDADRENMLTLTYTQANK
ncbi:MAG: sensor histidine kinase ResE, partial [Candidatus Parcubacteria bacterium]